MTITTGTSSPGQDLQHRFSTASVIPAQPDTTEVLAGAVQPIKASTQTGQSQTGQPEPGPSTESMLSVQVRTIGRLQVTGLDKWEGKILEVDGEIFTAELYPIDRAGISITADFDLNLLGSDAATVVPGDVFYLSVRTVKARGERPTRTESLRLRRLGRITPEEVQKVYAKADALMERLERLFG